MLMLTWRTFGAGRLLSFGNVCARSVRIRNDFKSWKRCSLAGYVVLEKVTLQFHSPCTCWDQPEPVPRSEMSREKLVCAGDASAQCSQLKLASLRSSSAAYCDFSRHGL